MLVITRKLDQKVFVRLPGGKTAYIQVVRLSPDQVKIGFEFPNEYVIERDDMSRPTRLEHPIRKPDTQRL